MSTTLLFELNGEEVQVEIDAEARLVDLLRDTLDCVDVKEGCGEGECGACTVLLDGKPVTSCVLFAWQVAGRKVTTVQGLAPEELARISASMESNGAVQCGFCTPGLVLTIKALLDAGGNLEREEIMAAISGNLCRCTGYERIVRAAEQLLGQGGAK